MVDSVEIIYEYEINYLVILIFLDLGDIEGCYCCFIILVSSVIELYNKKLNGRKE